MAADRPFPGADDDMDLLAPAVKGHPEAVGALEREPAGLAEEPEQHVLGADVVVLQSPGFVLGKYHDVPGLASKSLKHGTTVQQRSLPCQYHAINRVRFTLPAMEDVL